MKICLISLIYFLFLQANLCYAQDRQNQGWKLLERISGSSSIVKRVSGGDIIAVAKVTEEKKGNMEFQTLKVYGAGLHPKSCQFALRKLSLYENYKEYVGVISDSNYNDKTQRVTFHIRSSLLPFDMMMNFKIPRIKNPGDYPFTFDKGFLSGLRGKVRVYEDGNKCLLMIESDFHGPDTGINDTILEFFSQALIKLSLENLIRISKTY